MRMNSNSLNRKEIITMPINKTSIRIQLNTNHQLIKAANTVRATVLNNKEALSTAEITTLIRPKNKIQKDQVSQE